MITDDEIRDALEHLAQHAPDPYRLRHQFAVRDRVRRERRALALVGGAVAAGVAVGAPLVLLRGRHSPTPPNSLVPSAGPSPSPSVMNDRVPMRYRPAWLPDGMAETSRSVGAHFAGESDTQVRAWRNEATSQAVSLQVGGADSYDTTGLRRITVQGVSGWLDPGPPGRPSVAVIWPAEAGVLISVIVDGIAPGSTALPLQVANSVTTDGTSVLELPVAFGWLPDGLNRIGARSMEAAQQGWLARSSADNGKLPPEIAGVSVDIGTAADVLFWKPGMSTVPITVRGVTGTLVNQGILLVPLDGGLALRVAGEASVPDLVRLANSLRIGPVPDLSWLGRH